jgi:hypothetical protein
MPEAAIAEVRQGISPCTEACQKELSGEAPHGFRIFLLQLKSRIDVIAKPEDQYVTQVIVSLLAGCSPISV